MSKATLNFLDSTLRTVSYCEVYENLTYSVHFNEPGEFSCTLPHFTYIPRIGDYASAGGELYRIEAVTEDTRSDKYRVWGRGLLSFLSEEIITSDLCTHSEYDRILVMLLLYFRKMFPNTTVVNASLPKPEVYYAFSMGNVLDTVLDFSKAYELGIRIGFDKPSERFVIRVDDKCDRTHRSTSPLILSKDFDSVESYKFSTDLRQYRNHVTVVSPADSLGNYNSLSASAEEFDFGGGFDDSAQRRRKFLVSCNISRSAYTSEDGDGNEIFDEVGYYGALHSRARSALAMRRPKRELSCVLSSQAAEDVRVGDICSLRLSGISEGSAFVREMRFTFSGKHHECRAFLNL